MIVTIQKIRGADVVETEDTLAVEEPLEIKLAWREGTVSVQKPVSVTMRTPGHDEELAVGFLCTEGIINDRAAVEHAYSDGSTVLVILKTAPVLPVADRNFYAAAGCGICGKTGMDSLKLASPFAAVALPLRVPISVFYGLQEALQQKQVWFEQTGGLHAAALFSLDGECIVLREDIGRHNALDKVIGYALMGNQLPLEERILLLSGRAGFELIQKAYMAGVRVVAAVGAPSSLAVERAQECGMTLIGFLRGERFNVYTGWEAIGNEK